MNARRPKRSDRHRFTCRRHLSIHGTDPTVSQTSQRRTHQPQRTLPATNQIVVQRQHHPRSPTTQPQHHRRNLPLKLSNQQLRHTIRHARHRPAARLINRTNQAVAATGTKPLATHPPALLEPISHPRQHCCSLLLSADSNLPGSQTATNRTFHGHRNSHNQTPQRQQMGTTEGTQAGVHPNTVATTSVQATNLPTPRQMTSTCRTAAHLPANSQLTRTITPTPSVRHQAEAVLFTLHAAAGTAIGWALRQRPTLAVAAAAASHLLLDAIPHWGTDNKRTWLAVAATDVTIGTAATAHLISKAPAQHRRLLATTATAAIALDLPKIPRTFGLPVPFEPDWLRHLHSNIQRETNGTRRLTTSSLLAATALAVLHHQITNHHTDTKHHE